MCKNTLNEKSVLCGLLWYDDLRPILDRAIINVFDENEKCSCFDLDKSISEVSVGNCARNGDGHAIIKIQCTACGKVYAWTGDVMIKNVHNENKK